MVKQKNIIIDLILILITAGIWNVWMQYRQIRDYNKLIGKKEYSFFLWFILTLITFGLYHIYHEYILTKSILKLNKYSGDIEIVSLIAAGVSITGMWIFVDIYQQHLLNDSID